MSGFRESHKSHEQRLNDCKSYILVEQYLINTVDDNGPVGVSALSDNADEFRTSSIENCTKDAAWEQGSIYRLLNYL